MNKGKLVELGMGADNRMEHILGGPPLVIFLATLSGHRDAWIAGGAGDPNSGSAAFNELIRSFGIALRAGWKPLRTVVFASWDGEEYGLIGSTEWVEEYLPWLSASTVAYLNVDVGTKGPDFKLSAAPLLEQVVIEAGQSLPFLQPFPSHIIIH